MTRIKNTLADLQDFYILTLNCLIRDQDLYKNLIHHAGRLLALLTQVEKGRGTLDQLVSKDLLIRALHEIIRELKLQRNSKRYLNFEIY